MTHEEFEKIWLPAVRLLARSTVYLEDLTKISSYPPSKLAAELKDEINSFISVCPKVEDDVCPN
jgi:hypothetical protein